MTTWILVADTSRARLFTVELPEQPWSALETFENPSAHETSKELSPTPPGKMKQSGSGKARHTALEPRTTPKEAEALHFSQRLAEMLNEANVRGAYDRLVLVAPPHFLGMLRKALDKHSSAQLHHAVDKDLVRLDETELRDRLNAEVFALSR